MDSLGIWLHVQIVGGLVLLNALREELVNKENYQINWFLLDWGVDRVIKDRFHHLFHKFLNVIETLSDLFTVLLHSGILGDNSYGQNIRWEHIVDQHAGPDDLDPVRADGVLRVVPKDLFLPKYDLLVKYLVHDFDSVRFWQLVLVQVGQQES
jgi:hypothetical protein